MDTEPARRGHEMKLTGTALSLPRHSSRHLENPKGKGLQRSGAAAEQQLLASWF